MTENEMLALSRVEPFADSALIDTRQLRFDPVFRRYCEQNACGQYGANHSCPPDCGAPDEMFARLARFPRALVLRSQWDITDYNDLEAIERAKHAHNQAMLRLVEQYRAAGHPGEMCGAGYCDLCPRCARLDDLPCRFPERRFSCLSAYCVYVRGLAESCGMDYFCRNGGIAFFGLYAFE